MLERKVIKEINRGDEKAFRALYESYFPKVAAYAQKLLHSREDAREVAQDVFVKLWIKRRQLDSEQSISGLIYRITKFLCIDRIRKLEKTVKTATISTVVETAERSLEADYLSEELYSTYVTIIEKLPQKRKLIFELSRNKNLSHKEIAQKLNISPKTVEAQVRLALQQIRDGIKKYSTTVISMFVLFIESFV